MNQFSVVLARGHQSAQETAGVEKATRPRLRAEVDLLSRNGVAAPGYPRTVSSPEEAARGLALLGIVSQGSPFPTSRLRVARDRVRSCISLSAPFSGCPRLVHRLSLSPDRALPAHFPQAVLRGSPAPRATPALAIHTRGVA